MRARHLGGLLLAGTVHDGGPRQLPVIRAPREIRVVLAAPESVTSISTGQLPWRLVDAWGRTHAAGATGSPDGWKLERRENRLRVVAQGGVAGAWSDEPFAIVPTSAGDPVTWNGRRYRGELRLVAADTAILVVNVLALEEYLRGVVPVEIGVRGGAEGAAVEAQAIAARSYAVVRALENVTRSYDIVAGTSDQVYGGIDVEHPLADVGIRASAGAVLTWRGRVVRAPYSSTCGGTTAAPGDIWSGRPGAVGEAYLRRVSDIDENGQPWCSASPRFVWERAFTREAMAAVVGRHTGRNISSLRGLSAESTTASGRVSVLTVETEGEPVKLRGNDIRFALRDRDGAILNSTSFTIARPSAGVIVLRGRGNGHGVGMCQWGAIGRARAGQDARQILAAYYPGTVPGRLQ
ncbi:MAG: SpoIID/LytB domain-containing protein [Gemmatimonadota bacterium]